LGDPIIVKGNRRGIARLRAATGFSLAGLRAAWRSEEAFRLEVVLALILLPLALVLGRSVPERAALIATCLLVLIVELMNAAIETVVDRIGPAFHELSGRAKDIGSAAVFLTLVLTLLVWVAVAWDRFAAG
jgi:diacylglycerol kinase (ATP)